MSERFALNKLTISIAKIVESGAQNGNFYQLMIDLEHKLQC